MAFKYSAVHKIWSSRELSNAYTSLIKDNKKNIESALQIVGKAEGEVSAQRKLLTRELAEIGAMIVNREDAIDMLHTNLLR